ncbi:alpha/beta fold hydrolase [Yinghuangia sp. YIM S10712]|uniref:alpha/beta fold hydrolase n=1 Tax=Yinghuangia sp. YIM S10712 TaxID=3436930 RepID=UPI003F52E17B
MPRELLEPVMIGARSFGPQRSAARPFTDTELRRASVPMLVLLAGRSVLLHPERARDRVLTLVPHAEVEIVPGAGHGLPLEAPDLVNERILKFVEGRDLG